MTATTYERLNELMNERRVELGLRWATVAELAGITAPTLGAFRKGSNPPSDLTKRGVEKALEWQAGSIDAILLGGDPRLVEPSGNKVTTTADEDIAAALEGIRKLEEAWARKGPKTSRQLREAQRLRLAVEGLREALEEESNH